MHRKVRIACFSTDEVVNKIVSNVGMWGYYANNGEGFCVRYIVKSFYIKNINDPNIQLEIGTYEISYFEEDPEESWQRIDEIIAKLNLSDDMKETLDCFLSGKGYSETARMLDCAISTIYSRRKIFEKRYNSIL